MKKLLSILAAVSLTATASATVVACTADFSSITITTDENGDANFDAKVYLAKGQQIEEENDFYKLTNPNFDLIKSNDKLPNGSKQTSGVTNLTVTIKKKFFNGNTDAIKDGKLTKDLKMVAKFKFHVDAEQNNYQELFMLVSLKDGKVDKNLEKIKVNVRGTGAQPSFISATYDGDKAVTVVTKDLTKLEDKFDASKLSYSDGMNVKDAVLNDAGTSLVVTLNEPLKQYKSDKTYTITYKDVKLKAPLSASFQTKAVTLSETATLANNGKTITIVGTNLGTNADVKGSISSTEKPALDIASASTTDSLLTIALNTPIVKDYNNHDWTITYTLNSGDTLDSKLSLSAIGKPTFSSAVYDRANKTITVTGDNFSEFKDNKVIVADLKLVGTNATIDSASINDNMITVALGTDIEQFKEQKSYSISYEDTEDGLSITPVQFTVDATSINGNANYSNGTTITVNGSNLGTGDVTGSVNIDGLTVKKATVANTTLTIEIDKAIDQTYAEQNFNINYTLTGKETITSTFSVKGIDKPALSNAKYDKAKKQITITVSNPDNFIKGGFKKDKLSLDAKSKAKITDASLSGTTITATLDNEIQESTTKQPYAITYDDKDINLTISTNVDVEASTLQASATYDEASKTFTISGSNLGTHDNVTKSVKVNVVDPASELTVSKAETQENKLIVTLKDGIAKSYKDQVINIVYTLDSGEALKPATYTKAKTIEPTFGTAANYDGDKTITVEMKKPDNLIGGFDSSKLKINNKTKSQEVTGFTAALSGSTVTINLKDRLNDYSSDCDYEITYNDGILTKGLTSAFQTKGLSINATAVYNNDTTITIDGTNLGADRDVTNEITLDATRDDGKPSTTKVTVAKVANGKLVVTLNAAIGQISSTTKFTIDWKLTGGDSLSSSFTVQGSGLEQTGEYDQKTKVKIAGTNLGNIGNVADKVKIGNDSEKLEVAEASTTDSANKFSYAADNGSLNITLKNKPAAKYGDNRSFSVTYTLSSGDTISSQFSVDGVARPTMASATYDDGTKTITISGVNDDKFITFDQTKFKTDAGDIESAQQVNSTTIKIVLKSPIKKYKKEKSYTISYDDGNLQTNLQTPFKVPGTTLDSTAIYNDDGTITVKGANLGVNANVANNVTLSNGASITSASTTQDTLTIKISPIAKMFLDQDFTLDYKLDGGESFTGIKFTVVGDKALAPTLSAATYDANKKEVTVTGTNFDQIEWGGTFSIVDSNVTATKKTVNKDSIVLTLNDAIAEQDTKKTYQVKYTDSHLPDGITTTTGFDIKAKSVFTDAVLQPDNKTIKVTGKNFLTTDTTAATVTGQKVVSTKVLNENEIDVTLDKPIIAVYWQATNFTINLSNDGVSFKKDLSVAANGLTPKFTSAEYNPTAKTITISGSNFNQIANWDKTKFSGIPGGSTITSIDKKDTSLVLTLNNPIAQTDSVQNITVSYDDTHKTPLNVTFKVNAKGSISNAVLSDDKQTITVDTKNLPDSANANATVKDSSSSELGVKSSAISNNKLTIVLNSPIKDSYTDQQIFTISVQDTVNNVMLTTTLTVNPSTKPTFTSANYDEASLTLTISGTDLDKLSPLDITKLTVDGAGLDSSSKIKTQSSQSIVIQLAKPIEKTTDKKSVKIVYTDKSNNAFQTTCDVFAIVNMTAINLSHDGKTVTIDSDNLGKVNSATVKDVNNWIVNAPKLKSDGYINGNKDYKPNSITVSSSNIILKFDSPVGIPYKAVSDGGKWDKIESGSLKATYTDYGKYQKATSPELSIPTTGGEWLGCLDDGGAAYNKCDSYDGDNIVITISGKNIENLAGFNDISKWTITSDEEGLEIKISEIRLDASNKMCLILDKTASDIEYQNSNGGVSKANINVTFGSQSFSPQWLN